MCSLDEGFKLCSCGNKVMKKNFITKLLYRKKRVVKFPEMEPNSWHLFSLENEINLDGTLMFSEKTNEIRDNFISRFGHIANLLNTKIDCFDFPYSPKFNDKLDLCLNDGTTISFMFDKEWYLVTPGMYSLRDWDYWILNYGKIKK